MRLFYAPSLSDSSGNARYVLDCSGLDSGTHKTLRSRYIVDYALKSGISDIHLITAGNAGLSLKQEIEKRDLPVNLFHIVGKSLPEKVKKLLSNKKNRVIESDLERQYLSPEAINDLVGQSSFDATYVEGPQYNPLIELALSVNPDKIIVPVGSAELFNCSYLYIKNKKNMVKIIGVVPRYNHPLSRSNSPQYEKTLADKLGCRFITPRALSTARSALDDGHGIVNVDNNHVKSALRKAQELYISAEYSGAVSLAVSDEIYGRRVVCVLTGKCTLSL